jgi:hypothetical protein
MIRTIIIIIFALTVNELHMQNENNSIASEKRGGICFRVDDNRSIYNYLEFGDVFDRYDCDFTFALNLGQNLNQTYVNGVKTLQASGHELMDHTPNHKTNHFVTLFNPDDYIGLEGVEKVYDNTVCLKFRSINLSKCCFSGEGIVQNKHIISKQNGAFKDIKSDEVYVYLQNADTLVWIIEVKNSESNNPDSLRFKDLWHIPFDLGTIPNEHYFVFNQANVHLTTEGYKLLANETLKLADHYELERPRTWIQPGGSSHPMADRYDMRMSIGAMDSLSYISAAVYPGKSLKVYNEYNPDKDKNFGMQWCDFRDDTWPINSIKKEIADKIAKHRVLMGHSHFSGLLGGWDGYIDRVDEILHWCSNNNIPVKTYSDWAQILYFTDPDPFVNIVPPLNVDLDDNNVPDGYLHDPATISGVLEKTDGVPNALDYNYKIQCEGIICKIEGLGGVEKGSNKFEIWTKGSQGDSILVEFQYSNFIRPFKFPAVTDNWCKYELSKSSNGNTELFIPDSVSLIDITVSCSNYDHGVVKVSGLHLSKQRDIKPLNLKILLEGAYSSNSQMQLPNENRQLPLIQPYNRTPWNYTGSESVVTIPEGVIDWVLVELRLDENSSSCVYKRACFVMNNGEIKDLDGVSNLNLSSIGEGEYYVVVHHINHLPVISKNKVPL